MIRIESIFSSYKKSKAYNLIVIRITGGWELFVLATVGYDRAPTVVGDRTRAGATHCPKPFFRKPHEVVSLVFFVTSMYTACFTGVGVLHPFSNQAVHSGGNWSVA